MGTTIGEVNINLRMSLAQFKQDVKDGSNAATVASKDMANAVSGSSREATGSLALLGEEVGITIPRHLRTFITEIPGVGQALNAAFSSIAVIALIGLIVQVIQKIGEYRDKLKDNAAAWDEIGSTAAASMHKLDEEILTLQGRLDELKGDHVAALKDAIALINAQTLDAIGNQFDEVSKKADAAFAKMKVGWFQSMVAIGNDKGVQNVTEQFDIVMRRVQELKNLGQDAAIGGVLDAEMAHVKDALDTFQKWGTGSQAIKDALTAELTTLESLEAIYAKVNTVASDKTQVATMEAQAKATAAATARAKELAAELKHVMDALSRLHDTGLSPAVKAMGLPSGDTPDGIFSLGGITKGIDQSLPAYGGTKEAKDLLNLQTDQNEQLRMGSELYTATRTSAERYTQEMQVLNTLLETGAIDQDTYNKAVTEAKTKYDDLTKGLQQVGNTIGRDIAQAALYGQSWVSAFKDIAAEIVKVVIQMTILKSLQQSAAASGGGGFTGFLASIVGGLSGRAVGGPVYQGQGYMVGERGPEPFFPTTSGVIIPNGASRSQDTTAPVINNNEFHFHGVTDADSFRRSESQISAAMAAAMSRHAQRNG